MKRLIPEYEFSDEQRAEVNRLAKAIGISPVTAGIAYARGMATEEAMRAFLSPSKEHFLPPELMSGMREAKTLLEQAREERWNVAVFGDYDADGIGACAILSRALREFGIEPYLYIPERSEGYGLSIAAIDRIFDEFLPDLIVTVDCGISCAREVEYIKEQGAYVIVTDHHELPEIIPDCICINPKFHDDYPYDNLCGAGVAFKLATALIGEKANDLLDFCALSTVADSVPLLGENRDIVAEGLRLIADRPRPAFSALLGKTEEITAQTLAFTLAPRVNAAGRMGDARSALRLFTTEIPEEISPLAEKLNLYNAERQKLCDRLYETAREQIRKSGAFGNVVMAMGENWHAGLVGIVAARIAEEFSRPALLFVKNGDMLRGSARSIENVNIFEALKACSAYIEEFGGHAQAAGVNVKAENYEALKNALDEYVGSHYTEEDFTPTLSVCGEMPEESSSAFAKELNLLEPFGVGNRRPLFTATAERLTAAPLKPLSPHVTVSGGGLDFMYFGGAKELRLLRSDVPKTIVFEYNLSRFRGREFLKGYIRSVVYDGAGGDVSLDCIENAVLSFRNARGSDAERLSAAELDSLLAEKRSWRYGLCVVAYHRESLNAFPSLKGMPTDMFSLSSGSVRNTVLLAPEPGQDLSGFRDLVFLEEPAAIPFATGNAHIYINGDRKGEFPLSLSRENLLGIYAKLKTAGVLGGGTLAEAARGCDCLGFPPEQFVFALAVFEELGLASCSGGSYRLIRGVKTDLKNSAIYTGAQEYAQRRE